MDLYQRYEFRGVHRIYMFIMGTSNDSIYTVHCVYQTVPEYCVCVYYIYYYRR